MIGAELLRFSDRKIVLFDGECQRLNLLEDNLPFEWAWVVTQRGKILERHQYYLKWPNYKMGADAARITQFQQSWVETGDDPEFVLNAWESYAMDENYLLGGQNVIGFDTPLWQLWRVALGRPKDWSPLNRMLDTHLLSRAYKMGFKPDRANLRAWFHKVYNAHERGVKTGLSLMAKELGVEVDETKLHGADYDLYLTNAVLWKLANMMEI